MAGCFGNSKEDRSRERELNRYLDSLDEQSNKVTCQGDCGDQYDEDEVHTCTECGLVMCDTCAGTWHTIVYRALEHTLTDFYCEDCYKRLNAVNPEEYPLEA